MKLAREVEREHWHFSKGRAKSMQGEGTGMTASSGPKYSSPIAQRNFSGPSFYPRKDGVSNKPPDKSITLSNKPLALPTPPSKSMTPQAKSRSTRQYSHQEYQELRAKGLCFRCKLPYSPLHECPNKSLRALIGAEDEFVTEEGEFGEMEDVSGMGTTTELDEAHFSHLELPLYSVGGIQQPRTMKFQGSIAGHSIVVMVDSGASHNFISTQLVQFLNLPISATPTFNVKLGDGCKISSTAMLWPMESNSKITEAGNELDGEQKENQGQFQWNSDAQKSFDALKRAVVSSPVLIMPNFSLPFIIECDASGNGVGAVLMQQNRPIAFFSKAISDKSITRSAYERELMALVLAIQHWRPYLIGQNFIVRTDHRSLKYLLFQQVSTPAQQYWISKLMGYRFLVEYKSGSSNKVADALSRKEEDVELQLISIPQWADWDEIAKEVAADVFLGGIITDLKSGIKLHPNYSLIQDRLYFKGRASVMSSNMEQGNSVKADSGYPL
ncbi:hypothetical protein GH714_001617 [Hevea brasiliensis]|uniref:Reverse transcriptase/retrotransposon-derived protein RNase H-like domain-containing protein n=1 Tax=Hevea brasiliensis TaxID=3981 RepID=A0A6A6M6N5_HEVBR|nr:hypothetical protein GH714_001617 [Hevea brasiliensis]